MCKKRQKISLVGIGMGSRESMTLEAAEAICVCDCMIGAQRMLDSARELRYGTRTRLSGAGAVRATIRTGYLHIQRSTRNMTMWQYCSQEIGILQRSEEALGNVCRAS